MSKSSFFLKLFGCNLTHCRETSLNLTFADNGNTCTRLDTCKLNRGPKRGTCESFKNVCGRQFSNKKKIYIELRTFTVVIIEISVIYERTAVYFILFFLYSSISLIITYKQL
jgi:hypothetical protein